ncbi:putative pentatricopeptide repeat-containing protein At2g01510 [Selaginella moellendorffii]|uniref:putative pentatricopeptide repeat-containing protein At2g01510 n=1 Tax=Selaginella moellendorffii TaxID=88036 RepID=UPI000D1C22AD|nr:putative pentatricopeptide repeat-containing protein At2g01510 [Selaginella moellendorffii]|eukprot:XP_024536935.1 putative pentatricopeptide repeat-containing protein At2g01510 [Selaginella moellendorffii]
MDLFFRMIQDGDEESHCSPDGRVFMAALKACSLLATKEEATDHIGGKLVKIDHLEKGMRIHAGAIKAGFCNDSFVASALVDMYSKCGSMEDARRAFESMKQPPDVVLWTALMQGYAESGEADVALEMFFGRMIHSSDQTLLLLDPPFFSALLRACGSSGSLKSGKKLHGLASQCGLECQELLANCLVDLYCKCGSIVEAEQLFDALPARTLVTWSALIAGYSRQGDTDSVFQSVWRMIHDDGLRPDGVTFVSILTACSHAGLTDRGKSYFASMPSRFGVAPAMEHYICLIDIFGRGGELEAAVRVTETMPFEANVLAWRTVLAASRKWKNAAIGRRAFNALMLLDRRNASHYTLMANIYASLEMWEEQNEVEMMRGEARAWKMVVDDNSGLVHSFVAGDAGRHPQSRESRREMVAKLKDLDSSSVLRGAVSC